MFGYQSERCAEVLNLDLCPKVAVDYDFGKKSAGPMYDSPKGPLGETYEIDIDVTGVYILDGKNEVRDITHWIKSDIEFRTEVHNEVRKHIERLFSL